MYDEPFFINKATFQISASNKVKTDQNQNQISILQSTCGADTQDNFIKNSFGSYVV